jgi:four helix bundle protein
MTPVRSFEDLLVWQRPMDLAVEVYTLSKNFPKEELFGLTSQLRRAAVSISSNLAEGQGHGSKGEFMQFLGIARGSNAEGRSQLLLVRRLRLGEYRIQVCLALTLQVSMMLNALIATLKSAP